MQLFRIGSVDRTWRRLGRCALDISVGIAEAVNERVQRRIDAGLVGDGEGPDQMMDTPTREPTDWWAGVEAQFRIPDPRVFAEATIATRELVAASKVEGRELAALVESEHGIASAMMDLVCEGVHAIRLPGDDGELIEAEGAGDGLSRDQAQLIYANNLLVPLYTVTRHFGELDPAKKKRFGRSPQST